jgi:hypothetical protein
MKTPEAAARRVAWIATGVVALAALAFPLLSLSQAGAPSPQAGASATVAQPAPAQIHPAPARPAASAASARAGGKGVAVAKPVTRPLWRELSPSQQQALEPLSAHWDTLNEPQKRKWIALSANFPKMSGEEQAKLHSRMTEWVSLSPQQRTIARLNYGATRKLSPDDKKAKWEAYQALSPEEKKKLAAKAAKPPATAAALKPVPQEKLATVPKPRHEPAAKAPRIAAAPNQVDHNTLLPQRTPAPAGVAPAAAPTTVPAAGTGVQPQPTHQPTPPSPPQAGTPD